MLFRRKPKNNPSQKPDRDSDKEKADNFASSSRYTGELNRPIIVESDSPTSPKAIIYIHSLRLYELAQNPDLMTEAEKAALQQDASLMRTYRKYRQEFIR